MKKKICALLALGCSVFMSFTALAGQWKMDQNGWWYANDDGSYLTNCWKWLDGNDDGIAECYYFDQNGYMLANTITPDLYTVNETGAWTVNGVVQLKASSMLKDMETKEEPLSAYVGSYQETTGSGQQLTIVLEQDALKAYSETMPMITLVDGGTNMGVRVFKSFDGGEFNMFMFSNPNSLTFSHNFVIQNYTKN